MAIGIGRRQFMSAVDGAAVAWPLAARGQQPARPVIGFLSGISADAVSANGDRDAFVRGLAETGYIVGKNVIVEYRWADNRRRV